MPVMYIRIRRASAVVTLPSLSVSPGSRTSFTVGLVVGEVVVVVTTEEPGSVVTGYVVFHVVAYVVVVMVTVELSVVGAVVLPVVSVVPVVMSSHGKEGIVVV